MTTRDDVIRAVDAAWRDLRKSLEPATSLDVNLPGVCERWSIKTLLGHIAAWDAHATRVLLGAPARLPEDIDAFNERNARAGARLPYRQVARELEERHRALREAMRDAPDDAFEPESRIRSIIDADTVFHYEEHGAQIRAWLAERRKSR